MGHVLGSEDWVQRCTASLATSINPYANLGCKNLDQALNIAFFRCLKKAFKNLAMLIFRWFEPWALLGEMPFSAGIL